MWGQEHSASDNIGDSGIIPTRVGTRFSYPFSVEVSWDHPHACGDKYRTKSLPELKRRIIPTRVGTSLLEIRKVTVCGDHPHACGDK